MKCVKCGQAKDDYEFFSFRGNYLKEFFANPLTLTGQCFDCNAPYKCICCGIVQDANQFRVNGRICETCKTAGIHRPSPVADAFAAPTVLNAHNDTGNAVESVSE